MKCDGERQGLPCIIERYENDDSERVHCHVDTEDNKWIDYLHIRIGTK